MVRRASLIAALALLAAAPAATAAPTGTPTEIASPLSTPWEMVETSENRVLVTEIPGRIRVIENGVLNPTSVYTDAVRPAAKYLGLALSPTYTTDKLVYLYETRQTGPDDGISRVTKLVDNGASLAFVEVIFDGLDSDLRHDGGRIKFGPDGFLYVTTGDIHDHRRPRNIDNLNGKILRITAAGQPAPDNPFHTDGVRSGRDFVWSYGHRHPQGIAWDAAGRLWETEHGPSGEGPSGATDARDELNLIQPGQDYGWPAVAGEQYCTNVTTVAPVVHSGGTAWAPADLDYVETDGYLYAPTLAGQHLHVFDTGGAATVTQHAFKTFSPPERLRTAMMVSPTEMWLATHSNTHRVFSVGIAAGSAGLTWVANDSPQDEPKTCAARTEGPLPTPPGDTTTPPPTTSIPPPTTTPPPVTDGPVAGEPLVSPAARAATLARRLRTALSTLRLRGLLRSGSVGVRAGGFEAGGRVSVRLILRRPGRAALTVATGQARPASRAPVTVRVRLGRRGRAALRRATTARLTFRVASTPPGGAQVVRTATATVKR